jgi:hypothetical protein
VFTILISKIPSDSSPVPPPVAASKGARVEPGKQRNDTTRQQDEASRTQQRTAMRADAASKDVRPGELAGAVPPAASRPSDPSADSQDASSSGAPAASGSTSVASSAMEQTDPAKQADKLNCARQAWPYVDRKCRDDNANADSTTRPVRIIPTDRKAVVTAEPSATVPLPPPSPRAVARSNAAPAASEAPGESRSTTGSAPAQAEAPDRTAPVTTARPETTGHDAGGSPRESAREAPGATKNADRRQRRKVSRRERGHDAAIESRRSSEDTERSSREDAAGVREETRTARNRPDDDRVVREHRLPDGRRVIILRRTDDDEGPTRQVIRRRTAGRDDADEIAERPPLGLRMPPFFINPLSIGN